MKAYPYSAGNMYIEMDGRWTPSLTFQDDLLPQLPLLNPVTTTFVNRRTLGQRVGSRQGGFLVLSLKKD